MANTHTANARGMPVIPDWGPNSSQAMQCDQKIKQNKTKQERMKQNYKNP